MKLVTFQGYGEPRVGSLVEGKVVDLSLAYEAMRDASGDLRARQRAAAIVPSEMTEFLQGGEETLAEAEKACNWGLKNTSKSHRNMPIVVDEEETQLLAPVLKPEKIICVAHNFHDFLKEINQEPHPEPRIFSKFANSVVGWDAPVIRPNMSQALGYEAELGFVVARRCKNVPESQAYDCIAGYCTANDVSASDLTKRDVQNTRGKGFDSFAVLGPWIATRNEVPDPHSLGVWLRVNGNTLQESNTAQLVHNIPQILSFCSQIFTLEPGDVVMTGTPGGLAKDRNPPTYMNPGDLMETEIEGLGIARNPIVQEGEA